MIHSKRKAIREALNAGVGNKFKLLVGKEAVTKQYGPGVKVDITKGQDVLLKNFNYAEKIDNFMVLLGLGEQTIWLPWESIEIEVKESKDEEDEDD